MRILSPQPVDLRDLLRQTWARYAIPIAVTESHNGCTRDEQMRWTFEAWRHALDLRAEGVEVCAITPWALLGNYDWSSLITRKAGVYEAGTFDIRGPGVRATGMVDMLTRLGAGESAEAVALAHPVLLNRGWWRRDIRLTRPPYSCDPRDVHVPDPDVLQGPPLLILGGSGLLGSALVAACALRAIPCIQPGRNVLDLQHPDGFADALDRLRPWAVIDAAGWTDRDEAEAHAACHGGEHTKRGRPGASLPVAGHAVREPVLRPGARRGQHGAGRAADRQDRAWPADRARRPHHFSEPSAGPR